MQATRMLPSNVGRDMDKQLLVDCSRSWQTMKMPQRFSDILRRLSEMMSPFSVPCGRTGCNLRAVQGKPAYTGEKHR
eukprot:4541536-Pleurochrysis_carterae.AAC.1